MLVSYDDVRTSTIPCLSTTIFEPAHAATPVPPILHEKFVCKFVMVDLCKTPHGQQSNVQKGHTHTRLVLHNSLIGAVSWSV
jgi:hypothetical protein